MERYRAQVRLRPSDEVQPDTGAHHRHHAHHVAAGADDPDQAAGGAHRRDRYLEDCHHTG